MKLPLLFGMQTTTASHIIFDYNLGLIDALELFAGIIIFSDSKAEDKIRCKQYILTLNTVLFDLFDFNEI
jgi:hypothetical protein